MACHFLSCAFLPVFCLCLFFNLVCCSEYHSIVEKVVYKYPGNVRGDWELQECGDYSVCGVIRLRFWQPSTVHRLCRCVQGTECDWTWGHKDHPYTMPLDNRSQLKFCQKVTELKTCPALQTGMVVSDRAEGGVTAQETQAMCRCEWPAYWQLHRHYYRDYHNGTVVSHNYFRCAKLTKCKRYDFCGHVVNETFSTYYRCSCPVGTYCLNKDRTLRLASELLYSGPTFRAYCLPLTPSQP